ncbi:hypothetical protein ACKGJN_12705 [Gillisia sp. Q332]|uniref:hypothetical protein n=1 Tax=Gillisia xinjiangensis TaxID=3384765 RepID=UPI003919438A
MQKITTCLFLFFSFTVFSQEPEVQTEPKQEPIYHRDITKNEVSIGALNLVAFGALDVAYERIITPNTSWAVEAFILALNRDNEDIAEAYRKNFSLTGKFKYFFSERTAWGFYVNGLTMISTGENDKSFYNFDGIYQSVTENFTDLAVGFGLGGKFVAKQGFLLDLNAGIGRNLFNSESPTIIGQFGVNLGYRF